MPDKPWWTSNDYFKHLFCDWKTGWFLLYAPIDEKKRKEIEKIIPNENFKIVK